MNKERVIKALEVLSEECVKQYTANECNNCPLARLCTRAFVDDIASDELEVYIDRLKRDDR